MRTVVRDPLTRKVIGCAIAVHRGLGPGLLESAYQHCLAHELATQNIEFRFEVPVPIAYGTVRLDCGYRADFVIENDLLVELKAMDRILPIHEAQVLTYLKLLRIRQALLINFNVTRLVDGLNSYLSKDYQS